jgi:integrase
MQKRYSLYKRKLKSGWTFYARFLDDHDRRGPAINTKCATKTAADNWCIERLKSGTVTSRVNITFEKFTETFWKWGECPYLARQIQDKKREGERYAADRRQQLLTYILPTFGKMKLQKIIRQDIEKWKSEMRGKDLSSATLNHLIKNVKIIFKEAEYQQLISSNPASLVGLIGTDAKARGILSLDEIKELMNEKTINTVWEGDLQHFTINLIAVFAGCRLGEILGLRIRCLQKGSLIINATWNHILMGLKESTKTDIDRSIPISPKIEGYIWDCVKLLEYTEPEDLVFCNRLKAGKDIGLRYQPIDHSWVLKRFKRAMVRIGIKEADRVERNITFHSHRHFFNTYFRDRLPDYLLKRVTGHTTDKMTDHYTGVKDDDATRIINAQNEFLELVQG